MAYKRNPMRSERLDSLSRYMLSLPINTAMTASTQWMERTLDDSANRRIVMGQAFLTVDAILELYYNIINGLVVYPKIIKKHVMAELPFMATENILMECVKNGGNRQELHEIIRVHSMEAGKQVKLYGKNNDLIARIKKDEHFACIRDNIDSILNPKNFIGRAPQQTAEYVASLRPIFRKYADAENMSDNGVKV
jgi:adenylosuccinate lyase